MLLSPLTKEIMEALSYVSHDVMCIDFDLLHAFNNSFSGKIFDNLVNVKTVIKDFNSKPRNIYRYGVHLLPEICQEFIHSNGEYVSLRIIHFVLFAPLHCNIFSRYFALIH